MSRFIIGIDLGQAQDYTALAVLEQRLRATERTEPVVTYHSAIWQSGVRTTGPSKRVKHIPVVEASYHLRHLERFPLGTPYPKQVEKVQELHRLLKEQGQELKLIVDQTGVGRPVLDILRGTGLTAIAVTITAGNSVSREGRDYKVPKRDLVSTVQVLLQSGRLKIASSLPLAKTLIDELLAFKVSISLKGHDSYGNDVGMWRESAHDDLVLATALATWWGERMVAVRR